MTNWIGSFARKTRKLKEVEQELLVRDTRLLGNVAMEIFGGQEERERRGSWNGNDPGGSQFFGRISQRMQTSASGSLAIG